MLQKFNVYINVFITCKSSNQLQWFRFQIFRINLHSSSKYEYFYSHRKFDKKSLRWSETQNAKQSFRLDQSVSRFSDFKYFQMIYHIIYSQISRFMSRSQISNWNSKTFHLFYFVFVLITNKHHLHAQKFAKKNVFSSYEMTRYFRIFHVLIIFSYLNSNANFSENFHVLKKRSFHHIKRQIFSTFNDFRKCKIK